MIQTRAGLPNSCSKCGTRISAEMWWAEHVDAARAGVGVCDECHTPQAQPQANAPRIENALPKRPDAPQPETRKPKVKAK